MKILVPDVQSRKAFDIVNILQRVHGYELLLFSPPKKTMLLRAVYGQKVHRLSTHDYESFESDFLSAIEEDGGNLYIWMAVSEESTLYFYELIDNLPDVPVRSLLPHRSMFEIARNKLAFQAFCDEKGFPVPKSYVAGDRKVLERDFHPLIVKKCVGEGSVGMKYVEGPQELALLDEINPHDYLIQEKIESGRNIHGIFCLANEGEVVSWYGHERLRTFPEKGGVTVFSRAQYDDELKEIASRVLREMKWSGFAMLEFLRNDATSEWKIIELNPRLWGSVMLSEFCGANLLSNYVKLLTRESPASEKAIPDRYIRWIFPFELINLIKRNISLGEFVNREGKATCYINFTYSGFLRAFVFQAYFLLNRRSISRFFKKLKS